MNDNFFLQTSDEETAEILRKEGLEELEKNGKFFVFVNNKKIKFSNNVDKTKVLYTNKLCV